MALAAAALLAFAWLLLLARAPDVPARARPDAADVAAGRAAVAQLRAAQGSPQALLIVDARTLSGLAALASDASGYRHLDARLTPEGIRLALSIPAPLGQWLNIGVGVGAARTGFPPLALRIGRVPLPEWAGRRVAEAVRWWLGRRGTALPPLDTLVQRVSVSPGRVIAIVAMPGERRLIEDVLERGGFAPNPARAAELYCRLVAAQAREPTDDFAAHVRRAFAGGSGDPDGNRAAFAALAYLAAPEKGDEMAPAVAAAARRCPALPGPRPLLQGREDLAKHWAVSALLGSTLGSGAARAIGEWKELSDSLAGGSGFSFVDLSADRAGLRAARHAVDPATAASEAQRLATISADRLLPPSVTRQAEGMTQREFETRYGTLDARRYAAAVREIDRLLDTAAK